MSAGGHYVARGVTQEGAIFYNDEHVAHRAPWVWNPIIGGEVSTLFYAKTRAGFPPPIPIQPGGGLQPGHLGLLNVNPLLRPIYPTRVLPTGLNTPHLPRTTPSVASAQQLSFVTFNANSLVADAKKVDLLTLFNDSKANFIFVQETCLGSDNISIPNLPPLVGCIVSPTVPLTNGSRGLMTIANHPAAVHAHWASNPSVLTTMIVRTDLPNIFVINVYISPNHKEECHARLALAISAIYQRYNDAVILLGGDFNNRTQSALRRREGRPPLPTSSIHGVQRYTREELPRLFSRQCGLLCGLF